MQLTSVSVAVFIVYKMFNVPCSVVCDIMPQVAKSIKIAQTS